MRKKQYIRRRHRVFCTAYIRDHRHLVPDGPRDTVLYFYAAAGKEYHTGQQICKAKTKRTNSSYSLEPNLNKS